MSDRYAELGEKSKELDWRVTELEERFIDTQSSYHAHANAYSQDGKVIFQSQVLQERRD